MTRLVHLLKVVRLGEVRPPNLHEEGLAQIEELVLLVVSCEIRVFRVEIVRRFPVYRGHRVLSRSRHPDTGLLTVRNRCLARAQSANNKLLQNIISCVGMVVLLRVLHDGTNIR